MINKQELIFTVDENNQPIEPLERHAAHKQGVWHRTTDIAVVNSKNEILCHKRSILKDTGPGLWDACFGGHMAPGTEAVDGAVIELGEESGLIVKPADLEFAGTVPHIQANNKEFRYLFVYRWDGPFSDLKLEEDEVSEVKWVPIDVVRSNRENSAEWSTMPFLEMLLSKLVP